MDSTVVQDKLKGGIVSGAKWHFDHANQLVVTFDNKEVYNVRYLEDNKVSV